MYQMYLLGGNEEQKKAFLAGCRAIMNVLAHVPADGYGAILSRNDPDWILMLCTREQLRQQREMKDVATAILQHYNVNRTQFRGMILDCYGVNNDGEKIGPDGRPEGKAEYQYPHRFYLGDKGEELTPDEYMSKTEQQRAQYDMFFKTELTSKTGKDVKWVSQYDGAIMETLLEEILPSEPPAVLALYHEALEDVNATGILSDYRGEFEAFFEKYAAASDFFNYLNEMVNITGDNPEETE